MVAVQPVLETRSPTPLPPSDTPIPMITARQTTNISPAITVTFTLTPTMTETPPPPTNCPPPPGWQAILSAPGDTLESLASFYGTTVEALMQANCLLTSQILPGTRLYVPPKLPTPTERCVIPAGWVVYTVRYGDNLYTLGLMFKVSVQALMKANCLPSDKIYAGQKLFVPNLPTWTPVRPTATPSQTPLPSNTPTPFLTFTFTPIPSTAVPSSTWTPTVVIFTPTLTPANTELPTAISTDTPNPTETPVTPEATPTPFEEVGEQNGQP